MRSSDLLRRTALFVAVGLLLYASVYAASEILVYRTALRNRFYAVRVAPHPVYDTVILGASHALPLDFADANAILERATGTRIINLAMPGAGVVPNRLILEYFLQRHRARTVVYIVDSFIFTSREWNETRLRDVKLLQRAPLDAGLARLLLSYTSRGLAPPGVLVDYVTGFSKINNADRFRPDVTAMEADFAKVFRPSKSRAQRRVAFLYPTPPATEAVERYLALFSDLVEFLGRQGVPVIVAKLPVPAYYYELLPSEGEYTGRLAALLEGRAAFHDFSQVDNDEKFFLDTDHLNRDGVVNFFEQHLTALLLRYRNRTPATDLR